MIKKITLLLSTLLISIYALAQGYSVGDTVTNFTLKNIDKKNVSLNDYTSSKGVIVIFTCNHCPFSVAYEDRIIALDKKYRDLGYPVVAVNPNDPISYPADSYEEMKVRASEKGFTFPYLFDDGQKIYPKFGATKTPHAYLLQNNAGVFTVQYIGAIDDNVEEESKVTKRYVADAVNALIKGKKPKVKMTKAIGCSIKVKK